MDKRDNQFKATVNDELQYKMPPPPSKKNIISDKNLNTSILNYLKDMAGNISYLHSCL